jgi:hypothetical protein
MNMALGFNKLRQDERFLEAPAENDGLVDTLQGLLDLLKKPKEAAALVQQKLDAEKARSAAVRAKEDMALAQQQAEAGIDKARSEIARLRSEHDKLVAKREAELAARERHTHAAINWASRNSSHTPRPSIS